MDENRRIAPEIVTYYGAFPEESRLTQHASQLEFARTKLVFARVLPKPPATVIDVGGAAGAYSLWLASLGYEVHLVDATARLVDEARKRSADSETPIASMSVGDARQLPQDDASADAVLIMGPLYHLTEADDRLKALREAARVVKPGGSIVCAAISRYASALDGMARKLSLDPAFGSIRNRDLTDGQHRNETDNLEYFTTAYFHRPEDLRAEMISAGFANVAVLGVEGPAWLLPDFNDRWKNDASRRDLIDVATLLESEPSILGVSAHLLGVGKR